MQAVVLQSRRPDVGRVPVAPGSSDELSILPVPMRLDRLAGDVVVNTETRAARAGAATCRRGAAN